MDVVGNSKKSEGKPGGESTADTCDSQWTRIEKRQWLIVLFWSCGALYMTRMTTPLTVNSIAKEMGWSKAESGAALSSFFWGYTLTQVLGGYLSERYGGQLVLIATGACWALLTFWTPTLIYALMGSFGSLSTIVVLRVFVGAAQGFHLPSVTALTTRHLRTNERTFFFCMVTSGTQTGVVLLGYIGSIIIDWYSWPYVFYFTGLLGISWVLVLQYMNKKRKNILKLQSSFAPEVKYPTNSSIKNVNIKSIPWASLSSKPAFWAMFIGHICESTTWHVMGSWLPFYFKEVYPNAQASLYNVLPWFICIPSGILGGLVAEKLITRGYGVGCVRRTLETMSQGIKATSLLLLANSRRFSSSLTFITIAAAASSLHHSAIMVNPQDIAPKYAGSVFGVMNSAGSIMGFVGVYLTGCMLSATGSWAMVFSGVACLNLLGGFLFLLFGEGQPVV